MFMPRCFEIGKAPIHTLFGVLLGALLVHCMGRHIILHRGFCNPLGHKLVFDKNYIIYTNGNCKSGNSFSALYGHASVR